MKGESVAQAGGYVMKRILSRSLMLSLCLLLLLLAALGACSRAPEYALTLSAENSNPYVNGSTSITATLTNRGASVSGRNIVFTWMVKGGSQTPHSAPTLATSASGQAAYTLDNTANQGGHRVITVTATLESDPKVTATVDVRFGLFGDALPPGFIALSEFRMNGRGAVAYCQQQGGRLPRINDSDSWDGLDDAVLDAVIVEAFGAVGTDWPAGLPRGYYWTGTEHSGDLGYTDYVWGVRVVRDGVIGVISAYAAGTLAHVICIP
jgi:hypothetical protein